MHIEVDYKYLCQAFSKCLLNEECQNVSGHTILMVNYTRIIRITSFKSLMTMKRNLLICIQRNVL